MIVQRRAARARLEARFARSTGDGDEKRRRQTLQTPQRELRTLAAASATRRRRGGGGGSWRVQAHFQLTPPPPLPRTSSGLKNAASSKKKDSLRGARFCTFVRAFASLFISRTGASVDPYFNQWRRLANMSAPFNMRTLLIIVCSIEHRRARIRFAAFAQANSQSVSIGNRKSHS